MKPSLPRVATLTLMNRSSNQTYPHGDVFVTSWQSKTKHSSGLEETSCIIATETIDQIYVYWVMIESVVTIGHTVYLMC